MPGVFARVSETDAALRMDALDVNDNPNANDADALIDGDERKQLESMSALAKTYRPSGKPMSEEVCAAAMYQYANKRLSGVKRDAAVNAVADEFGSSPKTIRALVDRCINANAIMATDTSKNGAATHGNDERRLVSLSRYHDELRRLVLACQHRGRSISCQFIRAYFYQHHRVLFTYRHIRYYLTTYVNGKYGRMKYVRTFDPYDKNLRPLKLAFFEKYIAALKRQDVDKSAVIVYMDESYCHHNHHHEFSWSITSAAEGNRIKGSASKGKRFVMVHAITKDGIRHNPLHCLQSD
jgi:hypothetical protein